MPLTRPTLGLCGLRARTPTLAQFDDQSHATTSAAVSWIGQNDPSRLLQLPQRVWQSLHPLASIALTRVD